MKRYYLWVIIGLGVLLLVGLTKLGTSQVDAYPSMGKNCAGCHPEMAKPKAAPAKPAPAPAKPKAAPAKPKAAPAKPAPAPAKPKPAPGPTCVTCHPGVTSPEEGKGCGDCHEGGATHMKAPSATNIKTKPVSMTFMLRIDDASKTHLSLTEQGVRTCAGCHKHARRDVGKSGVLVPVKSTAGEYLGWAEVRDGTAYSLGTNTRVRSMYKDVTWEPGPGGGAFGATIWVSS